VQHFIQLAYYKINTSTNVSSVWVDFSGKRKHQKCVPAESQQATSLRLTASSAANFLYSIYFFSVLNSIQFNNDV